MVCPCFEATRREIFLDKPTCADMKWSVTDLLNFSYTPAIYDVYEGNWTCNDFTETNGRTSDVSLGLDVTEDESGGDLD